MDLMNFNNMEKSTNGKAQWLLVVCDVFTKKAFARPCKNKSADTVLEMFKDLFLNEIKNAKIIVSDLGMNSYSDFFFFFLSFYLCRKTTCRKRILQFQNACFSIATRYRTDCTKNKWTWCCRRATYLYYKEIDCALVLAK